jgi:hypothetical protein
MKMNRIFIATICIVLFSSFGNGKNKKFLDHFTTFKGDSLVLVSPEYDKLFKPDVAWEVKGTPIDTSLNHVFSKEEAEDVQYYMNDNGENSTHGYHKIKLDLGYYLVFIRAGGEYWNSRVYACLYHTGENKVTETILVGEDFGDAGTTFTCNSVLRKKDKTWTILVHEYFSEPVDWETFSKGEGGPIKVRNTDILFQLENVDDRYKFVEKDRKDKTEVVKY